MWKKRIKRIIKIIVVVLCVLIVWRLVFAKDESIFPTLVPTESSADLFSASELSVLTNDVVDEISDDGLFSAYAFYYIPETGEIQVTVRYNDSTVETLGDIEFYAYTVDTSAKPVESAEAGAGNAGDGSGEGAGYGNENERLHEGYPIGEILSPIYTEEKERLFYNYRKLIYSGVNIGEDTNIIISLCDRGNVESEHATLAVHFAEQTLERHKLNRKERAAFDAFIRSRSGDPDASASR